MEDTRHEATLQEAPAEIEEYSINDLKVEVNKVVWMFAAQSTTLGEAEKLANEVLQLFIANREKHGLTGTLRGM